MIQIDHVQTYGWEAAVRGMRNPMNSWAKSDSGPEGDPPRYTVGPNDLALMQRLVAAGTDHSKFMRMISISMDILAPLYFWKEYDTYKIGTVSDSCSTMHTIHKREFSVADFSREHLDVESNVILLSIIHRLNRARSDYLKSKNKDDWWQLIQLLPSSYMQLRTVTLNYQVARHIYHARRNHKLDEWHTLCDALEQLPCAKELIVA